MNREHQPDIYVRLYCIELREHRGSPRTSVDKAGAACAWANIRPVSCIGILTYPVRELSADKILLFLPQPLHLV